MVLPALKAYLEVHGDLLVPYAFVVPHGDKRWPEQCWEMKLGRNVKEIRSRQHFVKDHPERRAQLDAMGPGFVWRVR